MSGRRGRTLLTVIDQGCASAAMYVVVLLVARGSSADDFGVFLIAFGVVAALAAISRTAFGAVLGMDLPTLEGRVATMLVRRSAAAVLAIGVAAGVLLAVAAVFLDDGVRGTVLVLAIGVPLLLLQDVHRYSLVAAARPGIALAADLAWLMPGLLLLIGDIGRDDSVAARVAVLVWIAGLVLAAFLLAATGQIALPWARGVIAWLRTDVRRWHLAGDATLAGLAPVGNGLGAALVSGPSATAAVRGGSALFAPLAALAMAVSLGAVPEARRGPAARAEHFLLRVTGGLVAVSALWGIGLLLVTDDLGEVLLGKSWAVAEPVVPYLAVEYVGLAMWTGGTALLRFAHATREALRIRYWYAPASLVLPVVALALTDDVRVFGAVLAALGVGVGAVGLVQGRRAVAAVVSDGSGDRPDRAGC